MNELHQLEYRKWRKRFLSANLLVISLLLRAAESAAQSQSSGFDPAKGVIFPANKAKELTHQCSRDFPQLEGTWDPTALQIAQLEPILARALDAELAKYRDEGSRPHGSRDYYRQYGGVIVHGHRLIYVNGFSSDMTEFMPKSAEISRRTEADSWRRRPVNVCDGGINLFGAAFDMVTGTFLKLPSGIADGPENVRGIQFNGMG